MQAGRLRHRVIIERRVESQNGTGEVVWSWTEFARVSADVQPLSMRESFMAAQVASEVTTSIRIRYLEGVTPKMRVVHHDDYGSPTVASYYDVAGVRDIGSRRREMELLCVVRDAEGWRNG